MDRFETFLHYGFSREVYQTCMPDVVRHNIKSVRYLSRIFFGAMVIFLVLAVLGVNRRFVVVYGLEALVFGVLTAFVQRQELAQRFSMGVVVMVSVALVSFGIVASASDPTVVATAFHVLMIVVAIFFVTTMLPMMGVLAVGVVGLVGSSFWGKPAALVWGDASNAVIFFVVALVLHYVTSHDRIQNYLNLHELRTTRRELAIESHFDGLSGLFNRAHFFEIADGLDLTGDYTVCLIDIDNFKQVNDKYGHHTGDLTIAALGAAIRTTLGLKGKEGADAATAPAAGRKTFAGRLGGDEFIMLVGPDGPDPHEAGRRVQEIMAETTLGNLHGVGVSIGYASTREYPGIKVDKLYRVADVKMYVEKTAHHAGR